MSTSELVWRSMHDLGLASWFGGSVFGSVALPDTGSASGAQASGDGTTPRDVERVEATAWQRWTPVVLASMGTHLLGGAGLLAWNKGRVAAQSGVRTSTATKAALTAAAVGLTVYAGMEGRRAQALRESADAGLEQDGQAEQKLAQGRRRMRVVGALLPLTTGSLVVLGALHGEQQRPREMARGILANLPGISAG